MLSNLPELASESASAAVMEAPTNTGSSRAAAAQSGSLPQPGGCVRLHGKAPQQQRHTCRHPVVLAAPGQQAGMGPARQRQLLRLQLRLSGTELAMHASSLIYNRAALVPFPFTSGAQSTVKVPIYTWGPVNATGASNWLGFGAFTDVQLAKSGVVPMTNIKLTMAKTGGGVSSLQAMYAKAWGPARGANRSTDAAYSFSPGLNTQEFISAAFAKPGSGTLLDDLRFTTSTNRSIGGAFAKAADLQPLHPCAKMAPGRFKLVYISGNAATAQQDIAKSSKHLFSLVLYWMDTTVALPVRSLAGCSARPSAGPPSGVAGCSASCTDR